MNPATALPADAASRSLILARMRLRVLGFHLAVAAKAYLEIL